MQRGFKSRCEAMALSLRAELGLDESAPLAPEQLAGYLDVHILSVLDVGAEEADLNQLLKVDPDSWSAMTVSASGYDAIITNPFHRSGRLANDLMHELSHLLLGHEPTIMYVVGDEGLALREYDQGKEEEANWLAGVLLLPRPALLEAGRARIPERVICETYGVSKQMLKYRMNATGVRRQLTAGRVG